MGLGDLIIAASRIDLTAGLFGRKLSKKDMERAKRGDFRERRRILGGKFSREFLEKDGELIVVETSSSHRKTRDHSYGWRIPHKGYYPDKKTTSVYDAEGKLKERTTGYFSGAHDWEGHVRVTFNPHGRIIGQIQKSWGLLG